MQTAVMTSRFLIGHSSKAGFADSEIVVSHGGLIEHIVASHLAQTVSQDAILKLTNALIRSAEQAYMLRDLNALQEASDVLMVLPVDAARQIGLYYHALAINRKGHIDEAETLLEIVADSAPINYRARAIQTLGANNHYKGDLDEASRFQLEALRMVSAKNVNGLQTVLMAHLEISTIRSLNGDHQGALEKLENLRPLVDRIAKQKPFYFYAYCNELAIELGELGRIAEATAALGVALASPYAEAYPNWAETRQELAAKRTPATPSVVAISQPTEATPEVKPQAGAKRERVPAFCRLTINETSFQIPLAEIAKFKAIADGQTNRNTLDQLGSCFKARAPPGYLN